MKTNIAALMKLIQKNTHFTVMYHKNPDGDCLANAILWASFLASKRKQYRIAGVDLFPDRLQFLNDRYARFLGNKFVHVQEKKSLVSALPPSFRQSVLIIVDSSDFSRTDREPEDFAKFSAIINIDHHSDNEMFGTINVVDKKASSVGEITYSIFKACRYKIDKTVAELLYISIHSDTGGFSQKNTNKNSIAILCELLAIGPDIVYLNAMLKLRSYQKSVLLGRVLSRMKDVQKKLVWSYLCVKDMRELSLASYDTDGLIDEMTAIKGVEVVALFKEASPTCVRVSLRSRSEFNVKFIANKYKGGGHEKAAGCELAGSIEEAQRKLVDELVKSMGLE